MYDIFLSYKNTDENGLPTKDSKIAYKLFNELKNRGFSVFFSNESLKSLGSSRYKIDIDNALDSATIMIVILTKVEYATSQWVQYEYETFFNDIISGIKTNAKLFTLTDNVPIYSLPRTLRSIQNFIYDETNDNLFKYLESCFSNTFKSDIEIPQIKKNNEDFELLKGKQIQPEDIQQVLDLEAMVYKENERQSLSSCLKFFSINPEIYLFMKDKRTGKIIANIDISPITEECYEKLLSGHFSDKDITPDMILSYDLPCVYNLYFSSIVIHEDYRSTGLFLLMFNAVVEHFINLGEREVFAKKMLADAVTEEGEKFCKLFGMHKVKESDHDSKLYEVTLIPPQFRIISKATKILYEYYKKKYEESRYLF